MKEWFLLLNGWKFQKFRTSSFDVRNTLEKSLGREKKVMKEKKKSSQQALRSNADFSGITSIRDILNVINQVLFLESESGCMKIPTLMSE